jgi:ATP-dependent helicase/nuclease subunit B
VIAPDTLRVAVPADRLCWERVAATVLALRGQGGGADLGSLTVVLPTLHQAAPLREALRRLAFPGAAFVPPRMVAQDAWLGAGTEAALSRAEIFVALRRSRWLLEATGRPPESLWPLARQIADLGDELTFAAAAERPGSWREGVASFERRLLDTVAAQFRRHAARVVEPEAQLLLQIWRAAAPAQSAAQALHQLSERVQLPACDLVWITIGPAERWQQDFMAAWASRRPARLIELRCEPAVAQAPLLATAWPELAEGTEPGVPILQRAAALGAVEAPDWRILAADSLEAEASGVAQQIVAWLDEGNPQAVAGPLAVVALDRLAARRVRALLERAGVLLHDETGWLLSTTSAAGIVMRLFDLAQRDFPVRDVIDWFRSPFSLVDTDGKAAVVESIERALQGAGLVQGHAAVPAAVRESGSAQAAAAVDALAAEAAAMRRARARAPAEHAAELVAALQRLGVHRALAADPVGRDVLQVLETLARELASLRAGISVAEFRMLLESRFEECRTPGVGVDSRVIMTSLTGSRLRDFTAAMVIGADARHLPVACDETLFLSNALRAQLGLKTAADRERQDAEALAALLLRTPCVRFSWRRHQRGEPNALSAWLERLRWVLQRANPQHPVVQEAQAAEHRVAVAGTQRPACRLTAQAAGASPPLPSRLTASQAQALVACPYQFMARAVLALQQPAELSGLPLRRDLGSALHEILRRFHAQWGAAAFHELELPVLRQSLQAHADAVLAHMLERMPATLSFGVQVREFIPAYLAWLQAHARAGWRLQAVEFPCDITLDAGGRPVSLVGRLDRVDVAADGAVQVIDYKLRKAEDLEKSLQQPGEDLQLPWYVLMLQKSSGGQAPYEAAYLSFQSGADGTRVSLVQPRQAMADLARAVEERLCRDLARMAGGEPLQALGAEAVCTRCEARGLCRKDHWTADSEPVASAVPGGGDRQP